MNSDASSGSSIASPKRGAFRFILLLSLIGLSADVVYEGARSISGNYLAFLGAGAAAIAFIIGFSELVGYTPRLLTGSMADRTGRHWSFLFLGYGINAFVVPLMALCGNWTTAAVLIILERASKAIRAPARDALLSYAGVEVGRGWAFGLNEAITSIGAVLGPVIVSIVMMIQGDYQDAFLVLMLPGVIAVILLLFAWKNYPSPKEMERKTPTASENSLPRIFWIYVVGACCVAIAYIDFPFLSYHFDRIDSVPMVLIPVFYATANVIDAFGALFIGKFYDTAGMMVLIIITLISSLFVCFVFLDNTFLVLLGVALWGLGAASQESIMRAIIADMVPANKRASAFGIFSLLFGICWFIGTAAMGVIYNSSIIAVIVLSITVQLIAVCVFAYVMFLLKGYSGNQKNTS